MAVNKTILGYSAIIFVAGLIALVTSAMGVQCSNECEKYKKNHKGNHTWLSIVLFVSVLMVAGSLVGFYFGFTGKTEITVKARLPDNLKDAGSNPNTLAAPSVQSTPGGSAAPGGSSGTPAVDLDSLNKVMQDVKVLQDMKSSR